jgi:hypothetical protein
MRFSHPQELAAEYKRRGWRHIATYLERTERSFRDPSVYLLLDSLDEPIMISITEPYEFFHRLMELMEEVGSPADYQVSLVNECLGNPRDPERYLTEPPTLH